jgi:hypothetical protein
MGVRQAMKQQCVSDAVQPNRYRAGRGELLGRGRGRFKLEGFLEKGSLSPRERKDKRALYLFGDKYLLSILPNQQRARSDFCLIVYMVNYGRVRKCITQKSKRHGAVSSGTCFRIRLIWSSNGFLNRLRLNGCDRRDIKHRSHIARNFQVTPNACHFRGEKRHLKVTRNIRSFVRSLFFLVVALNIQVSPFPCDFKGGGKLAHLNVERNTISFLHSIALATPSIRWTDEQPFCRAEKQGGGGRGANWICVGSHPPLLFQVTPPASQKTALTGTWPFLKARVYAFESAFLARKEVRARADLRAAKKGGDDG